MMQATHIPPLGFDALMPLYDRVTGTLTHEAVWRTRHVEYIDVKRGEMIFDMNAGFDRVTVLDGIDTVTGRIEIIRAEKPHSLDKGGWTP